jgi:hypothetical protein
LEGPPRQPVVRLRASFPDGVLLVPRAPDAPVRFGLTESVDWGQAARRRQLMRKMEGAESG